MPLNLFCCLLCRQNTAALVCKAWRAAVDSPQLLRCVKIDINQGSPALQRMQGLHPWLAARAPHMEHLELAIFLPDGLPPAVKEEAGQLLCSIAAAAVGGLQELCLYFWGPLPAIGTWLASTTLRKLSLDHGSKRFDDLTNNYPIVVESLGGLPGLRDLTLVGKGTAHVLPGAQLPTSLSRLTFGALSNETLPRQVCFFSARVPGYCIVAEARPGAYHVVLPLDVALSTSSQLTTSPPALCSPATAAERSHWPGGPHSSAVHHVR